MTLALYAEQLDAGAQTLALGGWVGGALGVVSTIVSTYLAYRTSRDRLQLDADKLRLQLRVELLEANAARGEAECARRLELVRQEVVTVRLELEVEKGKTQRLEGQLAYEIGRRRQHVADLNTRVDQLDPSKSQGQSSLSLGGTGESAAG